jgi:hypothetical protein
MERDQLVQDPSLDEEMDRVLRNESDNFLVVEEIVEVEWDFLIE